MSDFCIVMADENKIYTFVLSDDSINSFGFRVLTSGIDIIQFEKNPVMLFMHKRTTAWNDAQFLPIGIWDNVRKENGQLLADAKFDPDDEFAQKIKVKVDNKILRMASMGFTPVSVSEDPKDLISGQTRPTITKSKLLEASIIDIGSNDNALRLYKDGEIVNLGQADKIELALKIDNNKIEIDNNKIKTDMTELELNKALGLDDKATIEQRSEKLAAITNEINALKAALSDTKTELAQANVKLAEYMAESEKTKKTELAQIITDQKLSAEQKTNLDQLAEQDIELALKMAKLMQPVAKLVNVIKPNNPAAPGLSNELAAKIDGKTFADLQKEGDLIYQLQSECPEKFQELYDAYIKKIDDEKMAKAMKLV